MGGSFPGKRHMSGKVIREAKAQIHAVMENTEGEENRPPEKRAFPAGKQASAAVVGERDSLILLKT